MVTETDSETQSNTKTAEVVRWSVATGKVLKRLLREANAGSVWGVWDRRCPLGDVLLYLSEQWKRRMEKNKRKAGFRRTEQQHCPAP